MRRLFRSRIRMTAVAGLAAGIIGTSLWLRAQANSSPPLPSLMPAGALLYLEAQDFHALVNEWNSSTEKQRWLGSDNFDVLSRSRLIQRLAQAQGEFASAVGIPIQMDLVNHLSGGRSAFAFYNLSRLTFVYLTEMPQSRFDSTDLWRGRSNYQARAAAGIPFYVKSGEGGRSVAFASYKDWFVVSSDEDRMAATLVLLSGQKAASIGTETWFSSAAQQAQTQGNLRLVYNLEALLATPQFRTYWIQRNASELRPFSSGISDLFENSDGFEEQRFLLRKTSAPAPMDDSSLKQVLRYAPAQSSLYRAWSSPDTALLSGILQQVVFGDSPLRPFIARWPQPLLLKRELSAMPRILKFELTNLPSSTPRSSLLRHSWTLCSRWSPRLCCMYRAHPCCATRFLSCPTAASCLSASIRTPLF